MIKDSDTSDKILVVSKAFDVPIWAGSMALLVVRESHHFGAKDQFSKIIFNGIELFISIAKLNNSQKRKLLLCLEFNRENF